MATYLVEVETCMGCGKRISYEASRKGWPIANLDGAYVGPCCYGNEALCPEGHVLDAHSESPECSTCEE